MGEPVSFRGTIPIIGAVNVKNGEILNPLENEVYTPPAIVVIDGSKCPQRIPQRRQRTPIYIVMCPENERETRTSGSSQKIDTEEKNKSFETVDKNKDNEISKDEFEQYFIQNYERNLGIRFANSNDPELAKAKKMAENIFNALKEKGKNTISKERFDKIIDYYDKASDGVKDGKIDVVYLQTDMEKFAREGKDAKISNGKTLEDLLA